MDTKFIDKLNATLPRLGFGTMRFPTKDDKIDYEQAKEMIEYAMSNGLNYFDTAYPYHKGESETFLGKVLPQYKRESYFLTSKLPLYAIETIEDAERIFNEQLTKCNTEYFDFYLLHAVNKKRVEKIEKLKLYDFVMEKKNQGKIKHLGFSFHDKLDVLSYLTDKYKWDFAQLQLNYYDWTEDDAKALYENLVKHNIPCFVMEPVRGGFLSSFASSVQQPMLDYSPDKSISSWALRWVSSLSNVAIVLSGMSDMSQLKDNLRTFTDFEPVNGEEKAILTETVKKLHDIKPVPCTGCRYCMDCPSGVDIPEIFEIYNDYKKTENVALVKKNYLRNLDENKRAGSCVSCQRCVSLCPQHINIPVALHKIDKEIKELH